MIPEQGMVLNDKDVLLEFDLVESVVELAWDLQACKSWGGTGVSVSCLLSGRNQLIELAREGMEGRWKHEQLE